MGLEEEEVDNVSEEGEEGKFEEVNDADNGVGVGKGIEKVEGI